MWILVIRSVLTTPPTGGLWAEKTYYVRLLSEECPYFHCSIGHSHFSIAATKHRDQGNLQKNSFNWGLMVPEG